MGRDHQSCVPVGPFAGELWHFEYFQTTTVRQLLIFDHMTVTVVRICCCIRNFIKIGSRVRPPEAHNCWMSRAPLLGNGRCHGNPFGGYVGNVMGCDQSSFVPIGPLLSELWYAQIFQHGGRPPLWILKIVIFDHVTVIAALTCCCVPNLSKLVHAFGLQTPITAGCSMHRW